VAHVEGVVVGPSFRKRGTQETGLGLARSLCHILVREAHKLVHIFGLDEGLASPGRVAFSRVGRG